VDRRARLLAFIWTSIALVGLDMQHQPVGLDLRLRRLLEEEQRRPAETGS